MKTYFAALFMLTFFSAAVHAQIITTYAGNGMETAYSGDGNPAISVSIYDPIGVAADDSGNVYISDFINMVVRKVNNMGIITTIAGNGAMADSGDGGSATAAGVGGPGPIALDAAGNLYIGDQETPSIRKVDRITGIITTVAGTGTAGTGGDGGLAVNAYISLPEGIAFDRKGNMYIADYGNNEIRKVDTAGIISIYAGYWYPPGPGAGGFAGDGGPATAAKLFGPTSVAVDSVGNVYIADQSNGRVRKVDTFGIINTIAGNGVDENTGDGGPASEAAVAILNSLCIDNMGNLYISTVGSSAGPSAVRKINNLGIITTVAGGDSSGYSGDGGQAVDARLNNPWGITVDHSGNIYIADNQNFRVRKITHSTVAVPVITTGQLQVTVYPDPIIDKATIVVTNAGGCEQHITLCDMAGSILLETGAKGNNSQSSLDTRALPPGLYLVTVQAGIQKQVTKVVKE